MIRIRLFWLLLIIGFAHGALGNGFNFYRYSLEEGLPQNYVYTLVQDSNSYLWIGTGEGLARFDGSRIELFTKADGLADNFVTASYRDSRGRVWFGHFDGTISCEEGGSFVTFRVDSIPLSRINVIYEDRDQRLWFVTQNSGLICFHQESRQMELLYDGLQDYLIYGMVQHPKGHFLLATNEGLVKMNDPVQSSLEISEPLSDFPTVKIKQLREKADRSGFYIGTEFFGFFSCSYSSNSAGITKDLNVKMENRLSSNTVETIFEDRDGLIWIGTDNGRLHLLNPSSYEGVVQHIDVSMLEGKPIRTVFQDRENNMWLGTYGGGLYLLKDKLFSIYSEWQGLPSNNVLSILIGKKGNYWIGTEGGLTIMDFTENATTTLTTADGLPGNEVTALFEDQNGTIWGGTARNGLFMVQLLDGEPRISFPPDALTYESINSIAQDQQGQVIVGTVSSGLYLLRPDVRKVENFTLTNGLSHNDVRQVFVDSKDRLWLATHGGPINMYANREIHYFGVESEVEGFNFNAFAEDLKGNVWVGSYGSGVYCYDGDKFKLFDRSSGLLSDYVYSISCDTKGNVWVGTKLGLSKIEALTEKVVNYPAAEHFESAEINLNAASADPNGDLWFGSNQGVVRFLSNSQEFNTVPPKINISSFRINGEEHPISGVKELPYGNYTIDLDYVAISLTNPEKVVYQYQLEGYENEWSNITFERGVRYSSLEDGTYTFKLRAANADGIFTPKPTVLRFNIAVPLWQTWWFRIFAIVVFGGILYGFIQIRISIYKRRQAELQHLVNERTSELQREKEKVENQNTIITSYYQDISSSISYA
ncbi:MAG: two-component regulator propeller domain-containing protein [Salibacteraceae bacterium]